MNARTLGLPGLLRAAAFFGLLLTVPLLNLPHWVLSMFIFVLVFAVMSSAWNLVGGFAGYPSLGHAAFFGIGAYAVMIPFQNVTLGSGYEVFYALPLVGLGAALIGWPIGLITMRTRADVFAIVTITLLFVVQTLAFNLRSLTGGSQGLNLIAPFAADTFERPFYLVLVLLLAVALGLTYATMRSKFGLSLASVRADEDKAVGIGVPVTGVKVLAFSISVGLTAMVGAVWAYYESNIYPQFAVDPLTTVAIVLMTFLGGRGTLWGPVLGAIVLEGGQQYLAYELGGKRLYLIAYALVFLIVIRWLPRGVLPTVEDRVRARRRRQAVDAAAAAAVDPAPHSASQAAEPGAETVVLRGGGPG